MKMKLFPLVTLTVTAGFSPLFCGIASGKAQVTRSIHIRNEPGKLESFLLANPNVLVKSQPLGTLPAPADSVVRFTAVVAEDAASKKKVKGLKVELKNGEQADVVYLDQEGLKQLADELKSQIETERFIEEHLDRYSPSELEKPGVNDAVNQSPATGEWYAPLVVGFYRSGEQFGVYLHAP